MDDQNRQSRLTASHHIDPEGFETIMVDPREHRSFSVSETADMIARRVRNTAPDEFRESLVRAGIVDEDGMLTEPYRKD